MWNVKLREAQRPTLLRDGKGGPMRVVTSSNWVKFETMPEYMINDENLIIEKIEAKPKAPEPKPAPVAEAAPAEEPKPKPAPRRRKKASKKAEA